MNTTIETAIIGTMVTFFAAFLTTVVSFFRERSEKEKWKRTLELEERRLKHEENRWVLELNNQREMELHKMRLQTYPEVFAALGQLSSYNIDQRNESQLMELADRFNQWGYGEAGLCMLPDTREAVFLLRDSIVKLAKNEVNPFHVVNSTRVDVIELMRRDLNHDWSLWRQFKPLIDVNRERIRRTLEGSIPESELPESPSPHKRFLYFETMGPTLIHGEDVQAVQQRLCELGYMQAGEADGYFGSSTQLAVQSFQEINELKVDGVVGPYTWTRLFSDDATSKL
jgi:hypothetical protein